ncbi:MAG: hypothetical protein KKE57_10395 [Proteobacteria bacterium]|nr:hypothetical protein [Pseudomonadota bacterium]
MRSYLIDELSSHDVEVMKEYLREKGSASELEGIFWIPLPPRLQTDLQSLHRSCQPFVFAVEMGKRWAKIELLIRSLTGLKCDCQDYPTQEQLTLILDFVHQMIRDLDLKT